MLKPNRRYKPLSGIESLEPRQMLTRFVVDTMVDQSIAAAAIPDGMISLREAVEASNRNAPFGDAPAGQSNGDSIFFDAGVFPSRQNTSIALNGPLEISETLRIDGGNRVTIDAGGNSRAFEVTGGNDVRLTQMAITGGSSPGGNGGAVEVTSGVGSRFILYKVTVLDSEAESGGAVASNGAQVQIRDSQFENNTAYEDGGAIFDQDGDVRLYNVAMTSNTAKRGGAIAKSGGSNLFLSKSNVTENTAHESGGGIFVDGASFVLLRVGSKVEGNSIDGDNTSATEFNGGGLAVSNTSRLRIDSGLVRTNEINPVTAGTSHSGGGIYFTGQQLEVVRSRVLGNRITGGTESNGGGIATTTKSLLVNESLIRGNRAEGAGGGLFVNAVDRSLAYLRNSTFALNVSGVGGGVGVLGAEAVREEIRVVDTDFVSNRARANLLGDRTNQFPADAGGGGIFLDDTHFHSTRATFQSNTAEDLSGGGIFAARTLVDSDSLTVESNTGANGGGLFMRGNRLELNNSTIDSNTSIGRGGGCYFREVDSSVTDTIISGNIADNDDFGGSGGGCYVGTDAKLTMIRGQIVDNTAESVGGGVSAVLATDLLFTGTTISGNTSQSPGRQSIAGGGGISSLAAPVTLRDVDLLDNSAINGEGGGIVVRGSTLRVFDSTVQGNVAGRGGGGINAHETRLRIERSTIGGPEPGQGNQANGSSGGGVDFFVPSTSLNRIEADIVDSVFEGNTAAYSGGGILAAGTSQLNMTDSVVRGNTSFGRAGGGGGGIATGNAQLIRTTIVDNRALDEGTIFRAGEGGGIDAFGSVTLIGSTVENNEADSDGGGIHISSFRGFVILNVSNVRSNRSDADNDADGEGGGVFCETVGSNSGSLITSVLSSVSGNSPTNIVDC